MTELRYRGRGIEVSGIEVLRLISIKISSNQFYYKIADNEINLFI